MAISTSVNIYNAKTKGFQYMSKVKSAYKRRGGQFTTFQAFNALKEILSGYEAFK